MLLLLSFGTRSLSVTKDHITVRAVHSTKKPTLMNKSHVTIGILVAGMSFGAYWIGRSAGPPPSAKVKTSSGTESSDLGQGSRIEGAVAGLERRLELLETRQALVGTVSSSAGIAPNVNSQIAQEQSPNVDDEDRNNREASQKADIEKRLASEPRDRRWAASTEEEIRRVVSTFSGDAGANLLVSTPLCTTR